VEARAAGAGAEVSGSGVRSSPNPGEPDADARNARRPRTAAPATDYGAVFATTPMLAIVSPFFIDGTAQT